ncbi:glycosyltransferase family 9 protein [Mucilaginibacter pallidiroseus]|uniref:Glycosyltransferase family 9 protein n=1 Tax=Mucilaginibacter pallidiroseus TaxID=2599295 RepID=A0A563U8C1_9SPHI|nr:glycosyltransferase family 9 protein [Mucilaginibacter pallidiroseus]TWR27578.1 glycosyltransferase family 9 protein [Mucilaginibacter pallidiroseus]
MHKSPLKILIYRIGSLGDTIIALPVFNKIREVYPDADITLLTNQPINSKAPALESVLGKHHYFNRVINYPSGSRSPKVLYNVWKQILSLKVDIAINLATTKMLKDLGSTKMAVLRDKLFLFSAGFPRLMGFPKTLRDYMLIPNPQTGEHEWEAERLVRRFKVLGDIPLDQDRYWDMHFSTQEQQLADEALSTLDKSKPILAVSVGTKMPSKDWEQSNWIALLEKLKKSFSDWQLVILGSPEEAERSELCLSTWGGSGVNLCGKTSPRVSGAILKKARLFIGHDSGPMHLAAAAGAPCVAIFAARALPRHWFPRGDNNTIIYHKTDCAGCGVEVCIEQKKKCILSITVDEVYQTATDMVNKTAAKYNNAFTGNN